MRDSDCALGVPKVEATQEPSLRDSIGLSAADSGDVRGAERFLRFVSRECAGLYLCSGLPEEIKNRIHSVGRDAELVGEFAAGFATADSDASRSVAAYVSQASEKLTWVGRAIAETRARKPAMRKPAMRTKKRKGTRR